MRRRRFSLLVGGRLDRHVMRLFALSYVAAFVLVVGLFLIVDMAANLDDYLEESASGGATGWDVARFYLLQLPFLYLQVSPFVTLVAGMFSGARLTRSNEVVAALNAGVSARRLFAPLFAGGLLLAFGMFGLREWASGSIGHERDALHDRIEEGREVPVYENFWVRDRQGRSLRIREYLAPEQGKGLPTMIGVSAARFADDRRTTLFAERATWDPAASDWRVQGGRSIRFGQSGKTQERFAWLSEVGVRVSPDAVELAWKGREHPLERSFSDCLRLLAREPANASYRTLFHYHLSFPLAGLVLLLVGLPFVVSQERGRSVERIAVGLFFCVVYFGLEFVSRTLGMTGQIGPMLASWLPILFFGSLGAVLFGSMRS